MDELRQLPVDLVGIIVLSLFLLVSVMLIAAGGSRLPARWWIGALVSGAIVVVAAIFIVLAVSALDSGDAPLGGVRWWAIAVAGAFGYLAGTDVQLLMGVVRRVQGSTPTVVAGALLGPVVLIGGVLLLVRV
jgi:hypothetical protein